MSSLALPCLVALGILRHLLHLRLHLWRPCGQPLVQIQLRVQFFLPLPWEAQSHECFDRLGVGQHLGVRVVLRLRQT